MNEIVWPERSAVFRAVDPKAVVATQMRVARVFMGVAGGHEELYERDIGALIDFIQ